MKYSGTAVIALLLATACGVAYCSTTSMNNTESDVKVSGVKVDNTDSVDFSHFNWLQKYPQLANIESNNQTAIIDKLRTSESISQLIGPINNPYGVRDDILDYIIQNVPHDNPKLLQATIQNAYIDNLAFYSKSDSDKLSFERKGSLSLHCMYMFSDKSPTNISRTIGKKMRDSKDRQSYISNLEQTVFAWQTLGSGYGANTEDAMCETGEYLK